MSADSVPSSKTNIFQSKQVILSNTEILIFAVNHHTSEFKGHNV